MFYSPDGYPEVNMGHVYLFIAIVVIGLPIIGAIFSSFKR